MLIQSEPWKSLRCTAACLVFTVCPHDWSYSEETFEQSDHGAHCTLCTCWYMAVDQQPTREWQNDNHCFWFLLGLFIYKSHSNLAMLSEKWTHKLTWMHAVLCSDHTMQIHSLYRCIVISQLKHSPICNRLNACAISLFTETNSCGAFAYGFFFLPSISMAFNRSNLLIRAISISIETTGNFWVCWNRWRRI